MSVIIFMLTQLYSKKYFYAFLPLRGGPARNLLGDWVNLDRPFWVEMEIK